MPLPVQAPCSDHYLKQHASRTHFYELVQQLVSEYELLARAKGGFQPEECAIKNGGLSNYVGSLNEEQRNLEQRNRVIEMKPVGVECPLKQGNEVLSTWRLNKLGQSNESTSASMGKQDSVASADADADSDGDRERDHKLWRFKTNGAMTQSNECEYGTSVKLNSVMHKVRRELNLAITSDKVCTIDIAHCLKLRGSEIEVQSVSDFLKQIQGKPMRDNLVKKRMKEIANVNLGLAEHYDVAIDVFVTHLQNDLHLEGPFGQLVGELQKMFLSEDAAGTIEMYMDIDAAEFDNEDDQIPKFERIFELLMAFAIIANAICLGIFAMDVSTDGAGKKVDVFFVVLFTCEMLVKMWYFGGVQSYLCGRDGKWNTFDTFIVAMGYAEILVTLFPTPSNFQPGSFMVLRMIRLVRILRLARVFKISVLRELKLMIYGAVGLLRTMACALLLLFMMIYCLGIMLAQMFGMASEDGSEMLMGQSDLFSTVPRSMFTVFRCLMVGDCSTVDGTPFNMHLYESTGWLYSLAYGTISVLLNYGFGSLITALVVDSTLNSAKQTEFKMSLKAEEKVKVARRLNHLANLMEEKNSQLYFQKEDSEDALPEKREGVMFISKEDFQKFCTMKDVSTLLGELDIEEVDQRDLFSAIDADGNGFIELPELIEGVLQMRGKARKVDILATRSMVEVTMKRLMHFQSSVFEHQQHMQLLLESAVGVMSPTASKR